MKPIAQFILQAITPSWKFFEEVGHIPRLSVKVGSEWMEWQPRYERSFVQFFINPQGNFELAKVTLLERFVEAIAEADEKAPETFLTSLPYRLVEALALEVLKKKMPEAKTVQFRIELQDQQAPSTREEVFVSPESES